MTNTDTVERVAKAMAFDRRGVLDASEDADDYWDHTSTDVQRDWLGTARAAIAALPQSRVPVPTDGNHDEALDWITSNCIAIRRDNGDLDYSLGQMIKAFEAGIAALRPAVPPTTPDPVSEGDHICEFYRIMNDTCSLCGRALTKDGEAG